jgi:hypothetical protein
VERQGSELRRPWSSAAGSKGAVRRSVVGSKYELLIDIALSYRLADGEKLATARFAIISRCGKWGYGCSPLDYRRGHRQRSVPQRCSPAALAAAYVQAGRIDEACSEIAAFRAVAPNTTISDVIRPWDYADPTLAEPWIDALRKAGLPEK